MDENSFPPPQTPVFGPTESEVPACEIDARSVERCLGFDSWVSSTVLKVENPHWMYPPGN